MNPSLALDIVVILDVDMSLILRLLEFTPSMMLYNAGDMQREKIL
jgi:hypothetical protein